MSTGDGDLTGDGILLIIMTHGTAGDGIVLGDIPIGMIGDGMVDIAIILGPTGEALGVAITDGTITTGDGTAQVTDGMATVDITMDVIIAVLMVVDQAEAITQVMAMADMPRAMELQHLQVAVDVLVVTPIMAI